MPVTIAIIGRPNVGKSTLFNRLVGRRLALVDDRPGVTRDRRQGEARIDDLSVSIIDTAGLEDAADETLAGRMRAQTDAAITEADLVLFMIDARAGVTPLDEHFAALARTAGKPLILIANKAEGRASDAGFYEAFSLGFGEPVAISAEHGLGLPDLYDAILDAVGVARQAAGEGDETSRNGKPVNIAVVGRPNAGKSTLINKMIGQERLLTGPEAGITRDSIAVDWTWQNKPFRLFDTAGIRRKARVTDKLEKLSVADALRAIRFAEVVILMMDATAPLEKQDLQIADLVAEEGRALVLALNKWDLVQNPQARLAELHADLGETLAQIRGVPMVPISAITGNGLDKLMEAVLTTHRIWDTRIATARLNRWLEMVTVRHPPPAAAGRRLRLKYLTQSKTRPPTFFLSCSRPDSLPEAYRRYLVNGLREEFGLAGVPIRLMVRRDRNPYEGRRKKR